MDFEGAWQGTVQTVQWMFSSSMPPDIITLMQPPYLTPEWRAGPHLDTVECIITYRVRNSACVWGGGGGGGGRYFKKSLSGEWITIAAECSVL